MVTLNNCKPLQKITTNLVHACGLCHWMHSLGNHQTCRDIDISCIEWWSAPAPLPHRTGLFKAKWPVG